MSRVTICLDRRDFYTPILVFDYPGPRYAFGTVMDCLVVYCVYGVYFECNIWS